VFHYGCLDRRRANLTLARDFRLFPCLQREDRGIALRTSPGGIRQGRGSWCANCARLPARMNWSCFADRVHRVGEASAETHALESSGRPSPSRCAPSNAACGSCVGSAEPPGAQDTHLRVSSFAGHRRPDRTGSTFASALYWEYGIPRFGDAGRGRETCSMARRIVEEVPTVSGE